MDEHGILKGIFASIGVLLAGLCVNGAVKVAKFVTRLPSRIKGIESRLTAHEEKQVAFMEKYESDRARSDEVQRATLEEISVIKADIRNSTKTQDRILDILERR